MQITDGTIRINAGYTLKVPTEEKYSSQDQHLGASIEFGFTGTMDEAYAVIEAFQPALAQRLKLGVFGQLGVSFVEAKEGVIVPTFGGAASTFTPAAAPQPAAAFPQPAAAPQAAPAAPVAGAPNWMGTAVRIEDIRPAKVAAGNPRMPDFKLWDPAGNEVKALWLTFPKGGENLESTSWLRSYGVAV